MGENKEIKVRLSTVVYLLIIAVLIVALGVVYYFGFIKNDNENNVIANGEVAEENNVSNDINNKTNTNITNVSQIKLGKNYIQSSETPLDDGVDTIDCNISFLENNKFKAYIGWGNSVSGTYSISDNNIIKCLINSAEGELSPEQNTYAEIYFKINSNTEIEVINASKTYKIKVTSLDEDGNRIVTNEDKEMPLSIEKGIKYVLEENIKYTYEEIKGLYTYTTEENSYSLYLWENGTFRYEHFGHSSDGYGGGGRVGNYIIEDNVIKLNYLFSFGTDTSLSVTKGNKELKIESNNIITFTDLDFDNNKILLKKDNNQKNNELYKNHDFFDMINEYCIYNKFNGR